jgi:hypothetical protein
MTFKLMFYYIEVHLLAQYIQSLLLVSAPSRAILGRNDAKIFVKEGNRKNERGFFLAYINILCTFRYVIWYLPYKASGMHGS